MGEAARGIVTMGEAARGVTAMGEAASSNGGGD